MRGLLCAMAWLLAPANSCVQWRAQKTVRMTANKRLLLRSMPDCIRWSVGDAVTVDSGLRREKSSACRVWMMNKPVRVVVARFDDRGRKTGTLHLVVLDVMWCGAGRG